MILGIVLGGKIYASDIENRISHVIGDATFSMRLAPAGSYPAGRDDLTIGSVANDFWIAETEVTYELWEEVLIWAESNGYVIPPYFGRIGRQGGDQNFQSNDPVGTVQHPVTSVTTYDIMVWLNALTEYYNAQHGTDYEPVYRYNNQVLRGSQDPDSRGLGFENGIVVINATGFRLPTSSEWELAARYQGSNGSYGSIEYPVSSGTYWTPNNYASGATGSDMESTMAAGWFRSNGNNQTQEVGLKPKKGNALGLYDMSGNVKEVCISITDQGYTPVAHGGGWMNIGLSVSMRSDGNYSGIFPDSGFRIAQNFVVDLPRYEVKYYIEHSIRR